jgi:hypothetical protein
MQEDERPLTKGEYGMPKGHKLVKFTNMRMCPLNRVGSHAIRTIRDGDIIILLCKKKIIVSEREKLAFTPARNLMFPPRRSRVCAQAHHGSCTEEDQGG